MRKVILIGMGLFFLTSSVDAQVASVTLPQPAPKGSARLALLKKNEEQEKWDLCATQAKTAYAVEVSLRGWVLGSWLRCARKAEAKGAGTGLSRLALNAFDQQAVLRSGPWAKSLMSEQVKTRFQVVERELRKASASKDLDVLLETLEGGDKESKARALALYGEWAQGQRDVEAAKLFFEQSLEAKETRPAREKYAQILLALNQSEPVKEPEAETLLNENERKFEERFMESQKSNNLLALVEDCVSYLNKFPQGQKANWAHDKILELYFYFLGQAQGGEEKWQVLRDRTLSLMEKAEWARLGEWSRLLHRRSDFEGSLRLAEKALSSAGNSSWSGVFLYVAGRSAQVIGDDRKAQRMFEAYAESHSAGDEIAEVLFRLGLSHLRQQQTSGAIAVFERLLALKNKDKFELGARYWMVRALQIAKSPRAAKESESLIQRFPFSYYGLKLRAEANQGTLEWPYPLETAQVLKGKIALTGSQKKSWDRIRALSAAGWRGEALAEVLSFPNPSEGRLKALLAQAWSQGQAYPMVIRLLNEASEDSVDFRTRDLITLGLPKDFSALVQGEAKKNGLQPILVWSLIRQESAFNPYAVSSSNALGLMQLIPPTAKEVAANLKLGSLEIPDDVFNPERNIPMGTSYLTQMIKQFQGSVPVGLAAYNAGPGRMGSFLRARPTLQERILAVPETPLDELWMDEIPWFETSFYVKAILRNTLMYRLLDQRRVSVEAAVWKDLILSPKAGPPGPTSASAAH